MEASRIGRRLAISDSQTGIFCLTDLNHNRFDAVGRQPTRSSIERFSFIFTNLSHCENVDFQSHFGTAKQDGGLSLPSRGAAPL